MSAPSTSGLSVELLLRVIDVKYGCLTFTHMSRQQRPFGSHVHAFTFFVMFCPILRSFSFLSFRNKFSLQIKKHGLE